MDIKEGLETLSKSKDTLDIYWLEDIQDDDTWWVDVCEDDLCERCEVNWCWTVISQKMVDTELEENLVDYSDDEDDSIIVVDKEFSYDVIEQTIDNWLKEKGFEFDLNIIPGDEY